MICKQTKAILDCDGWRSPSKANQHPGALYEKARAIRYCLVDGAHKYRVSHLGSSLSCVDILVAAYGGFLKLKKSQLKDPSRHRLILSKGHAAHALYWTLVAFDLLDEKVLSTLNQNGSQLAEQPLPGVTPGVEAATGSLGHGLPVGLGLALAAKIKSSGSQDALYQTLVVLSDGECNEGSVWEAALLAPTKGLNNLTVVIDANGWQATDRTKDVNHLAPLAEKWRSFGWHTTEVDGHDIEALIEAYQTPTEAPKAIVAHTVKGKGISFMEDDNNWHYRLPSEEDVQSAKEELFDISPGI